MYNNNAYYLFFISVEMFVSLKSWTLFFTHSLPSKLLSGFQTSESKFLFTVSLLYVLAQYLYENYVYIGQFCTIYIQCQRSVLIQEVVSIVKFVSCHGPTIKTGFK